MRLTEAIEGHRAHLEHERAYSANTGDAYGADLADLVRFAATQQVEEVGGLDLELLRDWLWQATERKLARATIARRAAAARSLTAWLHRSGQLPTDPGARLRAPKAQGRLPRVVGADQLRELFIGLEARAAEGDPSALRDLALVELIYGSALRVSEACGVDLDDVDLGALTVRVTGKGAKDRVVPFGVPAAREITAYRDRGRPVLAARGDGAAGAALFVGDRGGRLGPRSVHRLTSRLLEA
ncbi:tyrosine-type recombinase/integrase, partial [Amnibacterium sp.]|uniref:tyrosine-type recombinase/integrase n=1 Tax=Amnibacterium sp. TaxID=1872496 RepID=UPI003F7BE846